MVPLNHFLSEENRRSLEIFLNELVETSHIEDLAEETFISDTVAIQAVSSLRAFIVENRSEMGTLLCDPTISSKFLPFARQGIALVNDPALDSIVIQCESASTSIAGNGEVSSC